MVLRITVENPAGAVKASTQADDRAILVWDGFYTPGDRIRFTVPEAGKEWRIRVDDAVEEAQVLLTGTELVYEVPCGDAALPYNPNAFGAGRHLLTLRAATAGEMEAVRNLAANPIDQHDATDCFPHAHANAETRGEAVFFARNAIDGVTANTSHGVWPFATWGNDGRDDAEITVEFGRPVDLEEVALVTRADFPHDNWWVNGKLTFSNGIPCSCQWRKAISRIILRLPSTASNGSSCPTWLRPTIPRRGRLWYRSKLTVALPSKSLTGFGRSVSH